MPSKGFVKPEKLCRRRQVAMTDAELDRLKASSREAGLTQAKYMRQALIACWGQDRPKPKRATDTQNLAHELGLLSFQVKKLGTNVNQLAKQANQGAVPLHRSEVQYLLNQHQILFSQAIAAVEKMLA